MYKDGGRDPSIIGNTALQSTHDKSGNTHDRTHDALANTHDSAHDKAEQLLEFCLEPRHIMEIAEFLNYKERKSVRKILGPLVEQGRIVMTILDKPKSKIRYI